MAINKGSSHEYEEETVKLSSSQEVRRTLRSGSGAVAFLFLSVLFTLPCMAVTYRTLNSAVEWQVESSVFECQLTHAITSYGNAVFSRRAGETENFSLHQKNKLLPPGEAQIKVTHPNWSPGAAPRSLGSVSIIDDSVPLRLDQVFARKLEAELESGMRIVVTRSDQDNPVHVVLEPLRFSGAYAKYQHCVKHLLPVNYQQVSRTTIYFGDAAAEWLESETQKLDWLVQYVKADSGVEQVLIDGHTDSVGPRPANIDISKARAEGIATYLVKAGINADKITTQWHGERYPVAKNDTAEGRQTNRRVTVRLKRN